MTNAAPAEGVRLDLETARYKIAKITRREQRRNAPAPYTTSKLQQDATSYLHMGAKRAMQIAQALYEGIDLKRDGGPVGLITYMRTDSTRISDDAIAEAREVITTALRQGVRAREAERLQVAQERAGRARGDPPRRASTSTPTRSRST